MTRVGLEGLAVTFLMVVMWSEYSTGRRYRTCDEGCCVHEYCAFHLICYPKIHCRFGCPDGKCIGREPPTADGVGSAGHSGSNLEETQTHLSAREAEVSDFVKGHYAHHDNRGINPVSRPQERPTHTNSRIIIPAMNRRLANTIPDEQIKDSGKDNPSGMCMPLPPCSVSEFCGMSHSCSFNFNLGYNTCQYNLDIGSTLCYDNKGNPNLKPMS
ncbi:unnamed protein product [Lymnaea stagnalis]|uniref:Uncharacterized protein n=1 Tax=Lymnaea stagnalis TaxID=6523 RepID=A0AAV2H3U2_LYMST